ncbi:MAG: hypothetical protein CL868_00130 [Cytophagaceae bacterium]|nr:hypothetical protein [Flavobacteriaceae bacterium]MAZ25477.1 hypothetical protein [Cytophagaceae bacterium]
MKKIILIILAIITLNCKNTVSENENLNIAKQYYKALDDSDGSLMNLLIADSLTTHMTEYNYTEVFSKKRYVEDWLKWDSVFNPTYKILDIVEDNENVKVKFSKVDERILFLHHQPIITIEEITFLNGKLTKIESTYDIFNVEKFSKNVEDLVNWINDNHPELNGFLHDQTKSGGIKYLKAIELYKKSTHTKAL